MRLMVGESITLGSPPLTRELLAAHGGRIYNFRITPAYAGTTRTSQDLVMAREDHPRLRGNYFQHATKLSLTSGSPPLTRELLERYKGIFDMPGITPAYAGTTNHLHQKNLSTRDHPRLRGNYFCAYRFLLARTGSPPLTRELPSHHTPLPAQMGITPAYAGTTRGIKNR